MKWAIGGCFFLVGAHLVVRGIVALSRNEAAVFAGRGQAGPVSPEMAVALGLVLIGVVVYAAFPWSKKPRR
ncbi:MAG: hypothetical protein U1F61_16880 [Opitutaceae bacterium]